MRQTIKYRTSRLLLLLAGLLLTLPACNTELPISDGDDTTSTSVLRISTKGINVDGSNPEEYVKTLRLIVFQDGAVKYNGLYTDTELQGFDEIDINNDKYLIVPIEKKIKKGMVTIYAIANESGNNVETINDLNSVDNAASLEKTSITANGAPYDAPTENAPFLMTAKTETLVATDEATININLVRALAKVELASVTVEGVNNPTYSYSLSANADFYASYPLFKDMGTATTATQKAFKSSSLPLFLPESSGNAEITVSVTYEGKPYSASFSLSDIDELNHPETRIIRNDCIRITATIIPQNCLLLDIKPLVEGPDGSWGWGAVDLGPTFE
ncbi:hypothetical protein [Parabacteroides sp.]